MSQKEKLLELDEQIKSLQERKKKLEDQHLAEMAKMMKKLEADSLPTEILAGAIAESVTAFKQKNDITKQWQEKGIEILSSVRGKKREKTYFRKANSLEKTANENLPEDQ